jgi:cytochrome c-type biogenesis protein
MFQDISYTAALIAGLLSFFSPCVLPLIPAYFTFITGFSLDELTREPNATTRRKVVFSTIAYILGFSVIFIAMGASASFLGGILYRFADQIRIIGAILIILLGIHLTGIFRLKLLDFEKKVHLQSKPLHFLGTFVVGMAFGTGWSPCIGPLLGSILIIAGSKETVMEGILLLSVYSAGLGIPFLILSLFVGALLTFIKKAVHVLKYVNTTAGFILIIVGILLITNKLNFIPS